MTALPRTPSRLLRTLARAARDYTITPAGMRRAAEVERRIDEDEDLRVFGLVRALRREREELPELYAARLELLDLPACSRLRVVAERIVDLDRLSGAAGRRVS